MNSSLFKSEDGWKSLVQIMQNQCNVNFYLFVEACRFVYWFYHNFYAPMCRIYRTEYYRMIFRYTYRFATDFTGKINNHILKGRGNGGYSSRQARPIPIIFQKGKLLLKGVHYFSLSVMWWCIRDFVTGKEMLNKN